MQGTLVLQDGTKISGQSFGSERSVAGEVVFTTGMVGYPESLTDPSYTGQILVFTYPLIGNYGVADQSTWESDNIKVSAVVVSSYIDTPSHHASKETLSTWLKREHIPALEIKDTRFLTKKIRQEGTMLGKILLDTDLPFYNPDEDNLVAKVSIKQPITEGDGKKTIILFDCGAKNNIKKSLLKLGVKVITVPWHYDVFAHNVQFDGIMISNGPGDPKKATKTISIIKKALAKKVPTFGICLGNQLVALAAGGDTYKLKFGHRGQNQPCILDGTKSIFLTTQNHGFAINKIPKGFRPWFTNANDNTNEGIKHERYPFFSVQFHPEATPGPTDTMWLFEYFLKKL